MTTHVDPVYLKWQLSEDSWGKISLFQALIDEDQAWLTVSIFKQSFLKQLLTEGKYCKCLIFTAISSYFHVYSQDRNIANYKMIINVVSLTRTKSSYFPFHLKDRNIANSKMITCINILSLNKSQKEKPFEI